MPESLELSSSEAKLTRCVVTYVTLQWRLFNRLRGKNIEGRRLLTHALRQMGRQTDGQTDRRTDGYGELEKGAGMDLRDVCDIETKGKGEGGG